MLELCFLPGRSPLLLEAGVGVEALGAGAERFKTKSLTVTSLPAKVASSAGTEASALGVSEKLSPRAAESRAAGSGNENCKSFFLGPFVGEVTMPGNSIAGCEGAAGCGGAGAGAGFAGGGAAA